MEYRQTVAVERGNIQQSRGAINDGTSQDLHAMNCCLMISAGCDPGMDISIQLRTVRALSMVSAVVIVLETTTTRVDSASRPVHGKSVVRRDFLLYGRSLLNSNYTRWSVCTPNTPRAYSPNTASAR